MHDWLIPYFTFRGNCEEAVIFYQRILGGELKLMHFGDAPPNQSFPVTDEMKNLVLHAELRKDGHILRFSDIYPNAPYQTGNNISFSLEFDSKKETRDVFVKLSENGKIEMEPQETFFSPLYCKFTDQFGVMWQLSCRHL